MSDDELIQGLEEELKGSMPEECYNAFKRFNACKFNHDKEKYKELKFVKFEEYQTYALSRVDGCKNEYAKFNKCREDFFWRYIDLKNYVAEIEGRPLPYNKRALKADLKENLTKYNFGLNKF
jgi:hypothetical protein